MSQIIFLEPFFSPRPWGGTNLTKYGFKLPPGKKIGEAWVISAMEDGKESRIVGRGETLRSFFTANSHIFNNNAERYPLLSKVINAEKDLSIQLHPNDEYARLYENGASGKAECWYVLDCSSDAHVIYGHTAKTQDEFGRMVKKHEWAKLLKKVAIKPGDFIYVPPGKLHALTAGTCVFELQQSSDVTYRVYDYDRPDINGQLRPLHIKQSIAVVNVDEEEAVVSHINQGVLIDNGYFSLYLLNSYDTSVIDTSVTNYIQVTVLSGKGTIDGHQLQAGESAIIYNITSRLNVNGKIKALISYKKKTERIFHPWI